MDITYREPDPADREAARDALHDTADTLAAAVARDMPNEPLSKHDHLATLRALRILGDLVEDQAAAAARRAGVAGANWTELGAAWRFTRQSAAKKWPTAVPPPPTEDRPLSSKVRLGRDLPRLLNTAAYLLDEIAPLPPLSVRLLPNDDTPIWIVPASRGDAPRDLAETAAERLGLDPDPSSSPEIFRATGDLGGVGVTIHHHVESSTTWRPARDQASTTTAHAAELRALIDWSRALPAQGIHFLGTHGYDESFLISLTVDPDVLPALQAQATAPVAPDDGGAYRMEGVLPGGRSLTVQLTGASLPPADEAPAELPQPQVSSAVADSAAAPEVEEAAPDDAGTPRPGDLDRATAVLAAAGPLLEGLGAGAVHEALASLAAAVDDGEPEELEAALAEVRDLRTDVPPINRHRELAAAITALRQPALTSGDDQ